MGRNLLEPVLAAGSNLDLLVMLRAAPISPNAAALVRSCSYCRPWELRWAFRKLVIAPLWILEWERASPGEKCLLLLLEQRECCGDKQSQLYGTSISTEKLQLSFSSSSVGLALEILSLGEGFQLPFKSVFFFWAGLSEAQPMALPHCWNVIRAGQWDLEVSAWKRDASGSSEGW